MKVILLKDVTGFGRAGDIKETSDGHARNFLIPRKLAMPATTASLDRIQKEKKEKQDKIERANARAQELKKDLEHRTFIISGKANKQNLFAAIHEKQIADLINSKVHLGLEPNDIKLTNQIKSIGIHEATIKLSENTYAKVKIEVQSAQ